MSSPCVLVVSCCALDPGDIVKQILGKDELPEPEILQDEIRSYPWHIDTKYYTADVSICTASKRILGNQEFADRVQAIIVHFETEVSSFEMVKRWLSVLKEYDPEVRLLTCDNCSNDKPGCISRHDIFDFSLKNNCEVVELNPDVQSDDEEDDFMPETKGIKRIIQALHAHMWPNLKMKDKGKSAGPLGSMLNAKILSGDKIKIDDISNSLRDTNLNADSGGASENPNSSEADVEKSIDNMFNSEQELLQAIGNDDPESFEEMFSKFHSMKEKAMSLPPEERKAYAEKVAIAFWNAIGGDEDDIAGLDLPE